MPVYEDKERGTWFFKCSYKDWQGKTRQKLKRGFNLKREAQAAEREFLEKMSGSANITFARLCEYYIEDMTPRLAENTLTSKKGIISRVFLPYFANMPITQIDAKIIRRWQTEALKDYKPTTQKNYCINLSSIFNFAVDFYGLPKNPCKAAGSIGTLKAEKMEIWTPEQFYKFLALLKHKEEHKKSADFYVCLFSLLFFSGLRIREALALTLADYDSTTNSIRINKALTPKGTVKPMPKNEQSKRIVPLPDKIKPIMLEHIKNLQIQKPIARLFPNISHTSILFALTQYAQKAGLPHIRIHDLRHSHASMLIAANIPILAISKRLGHKNIETTFDVYGHLMPETNNQMLTILNDKVQEI